MPRNMSKYVVALLVACSISIVRCIMAMTSAGSLLDPLPSKRRMVMAASSNLPRLTSHQGDSGAKHNRMKIGTGQTHWIAKGTL